MLHDTHTILMTLASPTLCIPNTLSYPAYSGPLYLQQTLDLRYLDLWSGDYYTGCSLFILHAFFCWLRC